MVSTTESITPHGHVERNRSHACTPTKPAWQTRLP